MSDSICGKCGAHKENYKEAMGEECPCEWPSGEEGKWCPQHGYSEPCAKCNGMTQEEWDRFFKSLSKAVSNGN